METETITYELILETVRSWPKADQLRLVIEILEMVEAEITAKPTAKNTLDQAYGLLRKHSDEPAPTDEEVEQWLEEERWKKYGR